MAIFEHLRCPLCSQSLELVDRTLRCGNNHCFDRARQGYFNLLPVQQKRSKLPGDSASMVLSRRNFLDLGHYTPIAEAITELAIKALPTEGSLLDCGCGEGFYTEHLSRHLPPSSQLVGLDISKEAVKTACKRDKSATWIVASGAQIPVTDHSLDVLTCLFTPLSLAEFERILNPEGTLIIASTGPQHLLELRELIYEEVKLNYFDPTGELREQFKDAELSSQRLQFQFHLDTNEQILQLLAMTPHQWRAPAEARERLKQVKQLSLTADLFIHCVQMKS